MIRDPSDGSVREPGKTEIGIPTSRPMPGLAQGVTTGLPTDVKPTDDLARLQRSREWLKNYREARGQS